MADNRSRFRAILRERTVKIDTPVQIDRNDGVPIALRVAAAFSWRFLAIAAAIALFIWLIIQLKLLVVPFMVAILLTALLWPVFGALLRRNMPRWLAMVIVLVGTIMVVGGLLWLVGWQISLQWDEVKHRTGEATESLYAMLTTGPLQLSEADIQKWLDEGAKFLNEQRDFLLSGARLIGATLGHVITGALLALFILICLLADGEGIWKWTVRVFPQKARKAVDAAARNGWETVVNYARTQLLVASIDAVGIGLGAFLLGVPLAIPVAVLVFLGSFIPIVGAVLTGAIAVFLALVYNGLWIAVAMLAVVLGVQQFEGHILQPLLMGAAVKVHPLAVVLVVAGGAMIAGIPGALFAVPLAAFVNVAVLTVSSGAWRTGTDPEGEMIWSTVPAAPRRLTKEALR